MLDDDDGVAGVAQLVQHLQQQLDVVEVQAGGGLVQDVQGAAGVALAQFQRQLHALRLAAAERGGGLAQTDVAQAHVQQGLQLARQGGHGAEEAVSVFHGQFQHLRDVAALVEDLQRFAVVARALAHIAGHVHVGQEVHLHLDDAVAFAGFTAPAAAAAADVEAEAPGAVAALTRRRHVGEQLADGREQARVGGRVAARRAADGALVDVDDLVEMVQALDAVVRRRLGVAVVELARHGRIQGVVDQRALAAAAHTRHAGQQAHGNFDIHAFPVPALQVVAARAHDAQAEGRGAEAGGRAAVFGHLDAQHVAQVLAGE